ncbi:hypothetical protein A7982_12773 [Minicystis rosea]|nr:hypothetical protein A7982_12773 [Minicystis rosea]
MHHHSLRAIPFVAVALAAAALASACGGDIRLGEQLPDTTAGGTTTASTGGAGGAGNHGGAGGSGAGGSCAANCAASLVEGGFPCANPGLLKHEELYGCACGTMAKCEVECFPGSTAPDDFCADGPASEACRSCLQAKCTTDYDSCLVN